MSKQDRGLVRTASDLERKYNLASLVGIQKAVENSEEGLNKTNAILEEFMSATLGSIEELQSQVDGSISTWFFSGEPTLENQPANEWVTEEDKIAHLGDLYYDQDTGYAFRFIKDENGGYAWLKLSDSDVAEALAIANAAQDTADGKRRVFTATPYPPYDNGDLWFNNQEIYICQISKPEGESYDANDFIIATKYTDDTEAIKVGNELKVVSGTVTTIKESFDEFKVEITDTVKVLDEELKTAETSLQLVQGQITSKIWNNDIANALGGLEVGAVNLLNGSKDLSDSNSFFAEYNLTDGTNQLTYSGFALCV